MESISVRRSRGDRGFSLVEMLIVIVVLGILATVVTFAVRGIGDRGETAGCQEDRRIVTTAVEAYFAQTGAATIPSGSPVVPGVSGLDPEGTLVEFGLLSDSSGLHDVDAAGTVTAQAGSGC